MAIVSANLLKRLEHVIRSWKGEIFDGSLKCLLMRQLPEVLSGEIEPISDHLQWCQINALAPKILGSFLAPEKETIAIDRRGLELLVRLSVKASIDAEYFSKSIFTLGLGASVTSPSLRIPAYILPMVKTVERLSGLRRPDESPAFNCLPKIRVFKAQEVGCVVNDLPHDRVKEVTEQTFSLILSYLKRGRPHILPNLVLETEHDFVGRLLSEDRYATYLIRRVAAWLRAKPPELAQSLQAIARMEANHAGKHAELYAACHPFYCQDLVGESEMPLFPSFSQRPTNAPYLVVHFGGPTEVVFWRLRQWIADRVTTTMSRFYAPVSVQLITKVGKVPVYDTASPSPYWTQGEKGDLLIDDVCSTGGNIRFDPKRVNKLTIADFEAIDRDWPEGIDHYIQSVGQGIQKLVHNFRPPGWA